MNNISSTELALERILSKSTDINNKEEMLSFVNLSEQTLIKIVLSENVEDKLKQKAVSKFSLNKSILSEDSIKLIFDSKIPSMQVNNSIALLLPNCFSGTLVNFLARKNQLTSLSEEYLRSYIEKN